jgi:PPOX class probable F420-dependent enzyme
MDAAKARRLLAGSGVAHLATVDVEGKPHVVPICFALDGDTIFFAVDQKPKRTINLQRLRNIARNPHVAVLADHYEDDWERLWWVRVDGMAQVLDPGSAADHAISVLVGRYPQYRANRPGGPVVAIKIERLSGWSAT